MTLPVNVYLPTMQDALCTVIDYATGENWEMPLHLYLKYEYDTAHKKTYSDPSITWIEFWISTLEWDERELLTRK
jgi:hypothetical protein